VRPSRGSRGSGCGRLRRAGRSRRRSTRRECVMAGPQTARQEALAQIQPDPLDSVQLGGVGRQEQRREVGGPPAAENAACDQASRSSSPRCPFEGSASPRTTGPRSRHLPAAIPTSPHGSRTSPTRSLCFSKVRLEAQEPSTCTGRAARAPPTTFSGCRPAPRQTCVMRRSGAPRSRSRRPSRS
jgi:hypothetical protein